MRPRRVRLALALRPTLEARAKVPHEWVSFDDPGERRHWIFDVTFLLSNWTCIFGAGCKGVLTEDATGMGQGCCSYGAHFVDEDDARRVERAAATLTEEDWQFARRARRRGVVKRTRSGELMTRIVDGACIFLNRPGFPGGAGCALHTAALARGRRPLEFKPAVCWQLPLRREDSVEPDGWVTSRVVQWDRRHWGAGGFEFNWWCTDAPDAFVGHEPVYRAMRDELVEMCGADVYELLVAYLERRSDGAAPLVHPALVQPGAQRDQQ